MPTEFFEMIMAGNANLLSPKPQQPQPRVMTPEQQKRKQEEQLANIIALVLGAWAAYLSWTCNTLQGESTGAKVFYAFFAFMFGPWYLIYYYLAKRKECAGQVGAGEAAPVAFYYY